MGNHRDAEITEVLVVMEQRFENRMKDAAEQLKALGLEVFSIDEENNVVNGAVESSKVTVIQKMPGVNYVRSVLTYVADYPPGDPRDKDGVEEG